MAKNIDGRSGRTASSTTQDTTSNGSSGSLWTRRNPVSGRFAQSKKTGGAFKGARRAS